MKKNVVLSYKKDGRLNFASITLTNDHAEILKLSPDNRDIVLEYIDDVLTIHPYLNDSKILEENSKLKGKLIKLISIVKANYDKSRNSFKLYIPSGVVKNWELENNKVVDMTVSEDKIIFKQFKQEEVMGNEEIINIYSPEYIRTALPVITVKVEKGGVGKTFYGKRRNYKYI